MRVSTLVLLGVFGGLSLSATASTSTTGTSASRPLPSFNQLDRNNDGRLQAGELDPHDLREADQDDDGAVSREEYFRYVRRASQRV